MATDKEMKGFGFCLLRILIILCVIASPVSIGILDSPARAEMTPGSTLLATDRTNSTLEPLQAVSVDASTHNSWLYQGIVQLSFAGLIAWIIALLQKGGK